MKRIAALCAIVCLFAMPLAAQVTFSGAVHPSGGNSSGGSGGAVLPTPPAGATYFSNLQIPGGPNPGTWTLNDTQTCATPPCPGTGTESLTFGHATPSLSGAAMEFTIDSTTAGAQWNVLANRHLGNPLGSNFPPTHFELDFWVYYPPNNVIGCYEYDPDMYSGTDQYFMSWQLCYQGSNQTNLHLYSKQDSAWEPSSYPRPDTTPGIWHHVQFYGTMSTTTSSQYPGGSYTYQTLIWDGAYVFQNANITYGAGPYTGNQLLNVQFQLDSLGKSTGVSTEYLDDYNFVVW